MVLGEYEGLENYRTKETPPPGFSVSYKTKTLNTGLLRKTVAPPTKAKHPLAENLQRLIIEANPDRRVRFTLSLMKTPLLVVDEYVMTKTMGPHVNKLGALAVSWKCTENACPYHCNTLDGKITGEDRSHNHQKYTDGVVRNEFDTLKKQRMIDKSKHKNLVTDLRANDKLEFHNSFRSEESLWQIKKSLGENRKGFSKRCDTCMYNTKTEVGMKRHMIKFHNRGYNCEKCGHIARNYFNLRNHEKIKHEQIRFLCDQCKFSSSYNSHLTKHILAKHEGVTQNCDICKYKAVSLNSLKDHRVTEHEGRKFLCDKCNFQFTVERNLLTHIKIKHEGFRYSCKYCDYKVTQKRVLAMHQKKHSGEMPLIAVEKEIYKEKVETCESNQAKQETVKKINALENKNVCQQGHISTEQEKPPENYDLRFLSGSKEFTNIGKKSDNRYSDEVALKRSYGCDQCDFQCFERSQMVHHKDIHHEPGEIFTCTQCNFLAHYQSHLQDHIDIKHDENIYNCDKCDYEATCKSDLDHHTINMHKQYTVIDDDIAKKPEDQMCDEINLAIPVKSPKKDKDKNCDKFVMGTSQNSQFNDEQSSIKNGDTCHEQLEHYEEGKGKKGIIVGSHEDEERHTNEKTLEENSMKYIEILHKQSKHEGGLKECLKCECEKTFLESMSKLGKRRKSNDNDDRICMDVAEKKEQHDKPYRCTICSYSSSKKGNLWIHEKALHAGYILNCDLCDFMSPSLKLMRGHRLRAHGPTNMEYACEKCSYQSISQANLTEHMQVKHEGKRYLCNLCAYTALFKRQLLRHRRAKHEDINIICDQCEFQASSQQSMAYHKNLTHTGVRFSCDHCEYKAIMKRGLKQHVKAKHSGEENQKIIYSCGQCPSSFTWKTTLKNHVLTKHEGLLHKCELCDYKSSCKGRLRDHKRNIHEGIKYFCDQCDFQFTKATNLSAHVKIKHEGFRYSCGQCDYKVTQKRVLDKHLVKFHSEDLKTK